MACVTSVLIGLLISADCFVNVLASVFLSHWCYHGDDSMAI